MTSLKLPNNWPPAVKDHAVEVLLNVLAEIPSLHRAPVSSVQVICMTVPELKALRAALVPFGGEP